MERARENENRVILGQFNGDPMSDEPSVDDHRSETPIIDEIRRRDDRAKKAAANLTKGMSIREALMTAGYSTHTASRGIASIPKKVLRIMGRGAQNLRTLGEIEPEDQEKLVRGRLVYNVIKGQDKGVNSAYRLGQDKRVNMFTAESQTGIVILNAPTVVGTNETEVPREVIEGEKDTSEPK